MRADSRFNMKKSPWIYCFVCSEEVKEITVPLSGSVIPLVIAPEDISLAQKIIEHGCELLKIKNKNYE